ncbi:hypothetical protein [Falsigemmobacter intermedius]|uniref:hypothetical protein n=1 Tax=Falsigemmobacter intermedius TaxID=1553448 RepID=UPI003F09F6C8
MLDRGTFWAPAAEACAGFSTPNLTVRLLPVIAQQMVSGDLDAALARHGLAQAGGLLAEVPEGTHALRLARNRALIVGVGGEAQSAGFADGVAVTPMSGALAVLELSGPKAFEALQRASAIDFRKPSPCAALNFAGVTCVLAQQEGRLRLHLDRGLVAYMCDWLKTCGAA